MESLPLPYSWHKLLHILGVILFLGNILVSGAWMLLAERTKDLSILHFASKAVNGMDALFTLPGIVLILFNGLVLATQWGGIMKTGWIAVGLALFGLSGLIWMGFLLRYQRRLLWITRHCSQSKGPVPKEFFDVLHRWYFWGAIATILPLISLALMVIKPKLW